MRRITEKENAVNRFRKYALMIAAVILLMLAGSRKAYAYGNYTVGIGSTLKLSISTRGSIVPGTVKWSSSDSRVVRIVSGGTFSCTVQGVSSEYGSRATIRCTYAYIIGGTTVRTSDAFIVSLAGNTSGGSSLGSGSMTGNEHYRLIADTQNLVLDYGYSGRFQKTVQITAPNLDMSSPYSHFTMEAVYEGKYVSVFTDYGWYNRTCKFIFSAKRNVVGSETVEIVLKRNDFPVQKINIQVTVVCSHEGRYMTRITPATCSKEGLKISTCSNCGHTETEVLPRTGTHIAMTTVTAATINADGKIVKKCRDCGKILSETSIPRVASVKLSTAAYRYNGMIRTPWVVITDRYGNRIQSNNYTVTYPAGRKNAGIYRITVKFKGNYSGAKTVVFSIQRASQKILARVSSRTLSVNNLKKKSAVFSLGASAKTTLTYASSKEKYVQVNSKGTVTVKKGTPKGTYRILVKAKESGNYFGAQRIITIRVK